jgi:hypothetical protein
VYGERRNGIPIPRRITFSEPRARRTQTLEIKSVEFGPIPGNAFTLSFYGLPELNALPRSGRVNRVATAAFLAALVALTAALGLKYYANARRKK